jgi:hypothetical protein
MKRSELCWNVAHVGEALKILVEKLHRIELRRSGKWEDNTRNTYVQNLFNDADSNSEYIALSDRLIIE